MLQQGGGEAVLGKGWGGVGGEGKQNGKELERDAAGLRSFVHLPLSCLGVKALFLKPVETLWGEEGRRIHGDELGHSQNETGLCWNCL